MLDLLIMNSTVPHNTSVFQALLSFHYDTTCRANLAVCVFQATFVVCWVNQFIQFQSGTKITVYFSQLNRKIKLGHIWLIHFGTVTVLTEIQVNSLLKHFLFLIYKLSKLEKKLCVLSSASHIYYMLYRCYFCCNKTAPIWKKIV